MKTRCNFGKSWHCVATMPVTPSRPAKANHLTLLHFITVRSAINRTLGQLAHEKQSTSQNTWQGT
jgi:hypothetical protein